MPLARSSQGFGRANASKRITQREEVLPAILVPLALERHGHVDAQRADRREITHAEPRAVAEIAEVDLLAGEDVADVREDRAADGSPEDRESVLSVEQRHGAAAERQDRSDHLMR